MKLSDFVLLSWEEKEYVALHESILVGKRVNESYVLFLFQKEDFYIEMVCNRKSRMLEEVLVFDSPKALTPYLNSIKIDDLFT
ncbi:MAG TPA: hypothetical protein VEZ55_01535 [Chitinophagaceae bacterium]|jgi:hypothetical protein|nr:hypothetical protein [Chitinophagaceae bacterium]